MPGFDGTGPDFAGPMTGGARGWCAPDAGGAYGFRRRCGRAFRMGAGRGLGSKWGRGRYGLPTAPGPAADNSAHLQRLAARTSDLQQRLDALNRRIAVLKPSADDAPSDGDKGA